MEINLSPKGVFPKPIELNTPLGLIPHLWVRGYKQLDFF